MEEKELLKSLRKSKEKWGDLYEETKERANIEENIPSCRCPICGWLLFETTTQCSRCTFNDIKGCIDGTIDYIHEHENIEGIDNTEILLIDPVKIKVNINIIERKIEEIKKEYIAREIGLDEYVKDDDFLFKKLEEMKKKLSISNNKTIKRKTINFHKLTQEERSTILGGIDRINEKLNEIEKRYLSEEINQQEYIEMDNFLFRKLRELYDKLLSNAND